MRGVLVAHGPLFSRIAAAVLGGYALGALAGIGVLALPLAYSDAMVIGTLLSFIVHAGVVAWVFAVRSALRAWLGLLICAMPCALLALSLAHWGRT